VQVEDKTRYLFVNAELARFGLAEVHPIAGCRHIDLWQSVSNLQEQEAKPNKKGIWSGVPPNETNKHATQKLGEP
jgi:endonuclease YncB( thermonuclease family)